MDDSAASPASSSQLPAIVSRMAFALSCVDESIVWTDAHGRIQWCNAAFERLVNQTTESVAEQLLTQVLPLTLEGEAIPVSLHPVNWELATTQQREGQYGFRRHDRSFRLAITVAPLPCLEDDRTAGVMLVIRDLTTQLVQQRSLQRTTLELEEAVRVRTAELSATNAWVTNILESITDAFYTLDETWCFTYINHHAEQLLRHSQAELLGKNIWNCFPEAIASSFYTEFHRASETQCSIALESFYPPFNAWFDVRAYPIAKGLAVYFQDISDRKRLELERQQIEASLLESEQRFRKVFDLTAVATAITSLEGAYLQVNAAYYRAVGYTEAEMLTLSFQQIIHPDDIALGVLYRNKLAAGESSVCNVEKRCIHKDGRIVWCLSSLLIVRDSQQQPLYYVAQMQDITDRKQAEAALSESEARLKLALEAAQMSTWDWNVLTDEAIYSGHLNPGFSLPSTVQSAAYEDITERRQADQALQLTQFSIDRAADPIWWVKPDGTLCYVNDAACRDLGYTRDEIIGKQVSDFNKDRPDAAWADHWQMIKEQSALTFEARLQAKDGTLFPVEVTANYIELNGKEYHCSFVRNITDRKQAEDKLKASLTEKEVLLKEIHHRVKNNLQMVCSLLNLQANTIQDPKVLAPFQDSQRRIKAMALVHERLYQSESLANVNFSDYMHHLVTDLIHSCSTDPTKINLKLEIAQLELAVNVAIPCSLIINELVTNALKYAFPDDRAGEIQICFSLSTANQYLLVVADDGVGFLTPTAALNHVPPLDSLGLQLVHAFVHQLRGKIELDCSRGTRFELSFPNLTQKG